MAATDDRRPNDRTRTVLVALLVVVAAGLALHWLKPVALPLVLAIFLIAAAWPVQLCFERFVPPWAAYLGTILCIVSSFLIFGTALLAALAALAAGLPEYGDAMAATAERAQQQARRLGLPTLDETERLGEWLTQAAPAMAGVVYEGLRLLAVALVFVILGVIEVRTLDARLDASLSVIRAEQVRRAVGRMARRFRRAFLAYSAIALLTGALTWMMTAAVGLDFALVWGLLAFLLSYILFVGPVLSVVPPALFALVQFDGVGIPLGLLASLAAMQFLIGTYMLPRLESRVVSVSPLLLMIALFFWMLAWGILGAIMAIPLTIGLLILCEQFDGTRWIAVLLQHDTRHHKCP